jgi:hypothetical protein
MVFDILIVMKYNLSGITKVPHTTSTRQYWRNDMLRSIINLFTNPLKDEFSDHNAKGCTLMEKSFGDFLDSNTVTCPHGCGETIRVTDQEAHSSYGCAAATKIGRGPVKTAAV